MLNRVNSSLLMSRLNGDATSLYPTKTQLSMKLSLTFIWAARSLANRRLPVAAEKTPMVHRRKNTPHSCSTGRFVPLGKAQVSSHCHARDSPHQIPRRVFLSLLSLQVRDVSLILRETIRETIGNFGEWMEREPRSMSVRRLPAPSSAPVASRSSYYGPSLRPFPARVSALSFFPPPRVLPPISLAHVRIFPVSVVITS